MHDDVIQNRESALQKYDLGERLEGSHAVGEGGSATFEKVGSSSENDTSQKSRQMNH